MFLVTQPDRIWGWEDGERPRYATAERALVDVISNARYGVSVSQALSALSLAVGRDSRYLDRLRDGVERYGEQATARRVGLLVDRLFGADAASPFLELIGTRRAPVLLRPTGAAHGPLDAKWGVTVNVDIVPERLGA